MLNIQILKQTSLSSFSPLMNMVTNILVTLKINFVLPPPHDYTLRIQISVNKIDRSMDFDFSTVVYVITHSGTHLAHFGHFSPVS